MRKNRELLRALRAGVLGLSLTLLIPSALVSAQNNNNNSTNANNTNTTTTTRTEVRADDRRDDRRDDDTDWGWLGLLGLAGLLGLMPRKRVPVVHETRQETREVRDRAPDANRR